MILRHAGDEPRSFSHFLTVATSSAAKFGGATFKSEGREVKLRQHLREPVVAVEVEDGVPYAVYADSFGDK